MVMMTFSYVITDEVGLHARPAGLLVKEIGKYTADTVISCNGKDADGKRLLALMGLGAKQGDEVSVSISGKDEESAVENLKEFFKMNL